MDRQFLVVLAVIIAALGGVFFFTKEKATTPGVNGNGGSSAQLSEHVVGAGNKGVTLIEYGDLECPACGQYFPLVKQVRDMYKDDIKFQYRNFPLNNKHPNAFAAHRAAEAAGKQGKFFEMHDLLYENQNSWNAQSGTSTAQAAKIFEAYAGQLGLKLDQFKTDVASEAVANVINADIKSGRALKVESTPTFVINGKKLDKNPGSLEDFKKLIDDAIQAAAKT